MRFFGSAHRVSKSSRQQASDGVYNDHGWQRAIGEDIVPNAQGIVGQMLSDSLVEPLVAPANQNHMIQGR